MLSKAKQQTFFVKVVSLSAIIKHIFFLLATRKNLCTYVVYPTFCFIKGCVPNLMRLLFPLCYNKYLMFGFYST